MLDVCLLGTGGTVPLPQRWLTSCLLRCDGKMILIDCGEGTQIALHGMGFSVKHIDTILLTHYHADHTAGLPGLLLSMAKADRTDPITIYGPKGLPDLLQGISMIARYVPFPIHYHEIRERQEQFKEAGLQITAFAVRHSVPCYSYQFILPRSPRFDKAKAESNHVPLKAWNQLQKGNTVEMDGVTYTPDMVCCKARRGLKVVYSTDTRPVEALETYCRDADLYIGEGMYGDPEKADKAKLNQHSMMYETAAIAAKANVRQLWLTHYSPSMIDPDQYADQVKAIFANTVIAHDGQRTDLNFIDEEEAH